MKRFFKFGLVMCLIASTMLSFGAVPAFAKEKSYYEITEGTCDELVNMILLGGGGDNKVFKDGKDYGKVNKDNIIKALDKNKINVLAGHSTGANQIELFIKDGSLEDYIDIFVIMDGQAYVGEDLYCGGDTKHPVLICMSDQLNRTDSYIMKNQYSNYELYYMRGMKHVNLATEHFGDILDIVHNYLERHEIDSVEDISKSLKIYQPEQELIDLTVQGIWDDADDQDRKRPDSITATLYTGNTMIERQTITPDSKGKWSCTYTDLLKYQENVEIEYYYEQKNLPKDKNGVAMEYRLVVQTIRDYQSDVESTDDGFKITCKHTPEVISMKGSINWLDRNNRFLTRPEEVKIYLMSGDTVVAEKEVSAEDGWRFEFKDIPKYSDGEIVSYAFAEDEVEGYSTSVSGRTITNTRIS